MYLLGILNHFNLSMRIWGNILCIKLLPQVNCTKVFLFNPHPITVFPKDSIFIPSLHSPTPVSLNITTAALFFPPFFFSDHYSRCYFEI